MRISDCFALFSLPHTASKEEVKKRYRYLVKKYHPDTSSAMSSRAKFEQIQEAYELIKAFFEFKENFISEDISVTDERLERIKRARKIKKERKARERKQLLDAIRTFKTSVWYKVSQFFVVFSVVLASIILADNLLPNVIIQKHIQNVQFSDSNTALVTIGDRDLEIPYSDAFLLQYVDKVLIEQTQLFSQVKKIHYVAPDNTKQHVLYYSLYNDGYIILVFLLLLGLQTYYINQSSFQYYVIIRFYNTIILPLICFYVLFGEKRIVGLLGLL
ncbi:MAG: J domain-containing protein [Bacteroidales bacterium]